MVESDLNFVSRSVSQGFLFSLYDTGIASIDKAGFWEPPVFDEMASGAYWTMGDSFIAEMPGDARSLLKN